MNLDASDCVKSHSMQATGTNDYIIYNVGTITMLNILKNHAFSYKS